MCMFVSAIVVKKFSFESKFCEGWRDTCGFRNLSQLIGGVYRSSLCSSQALGALQ